MIETALHYAEKGWQVFPLLPNDKRPATENGFKAATTQRAIIEGWWLRWPDANVGIVTGSVSGIVVLDVDRKHGVDGVLAATELDLPETLVVKTPSGGFHLFFTLPDGVSVPRRIGVKPGLDILGDGGYVVAAGSRVNGAVYEIVRNRPMVPCPDVLVKLAAHHKAATVTPIAGKVSAGGRNQYLASMAGKMRRMGSDEVEIAAALMAVNEQRNEPPLPEAEVRRTALSIARYAPATTGGYQGPRPEIGSGDRDNAPPDWQTEVQRAAHLPPVEYDRERKAIAGRLGCRPATLDAQVQKLRGDAQSDGQGRALTFNPVEPWAEVVDGAMLLDEMTAIIRRYVILPDHAAEGCALWAVMTWVAEELDCLPLLRVLSPTKGCGKSTLLEVMALLVHRPLTAAGISAAALFRVIELHGPTMLMDEVDTYLVESEDHRQILNAGHTRAAAFVVRTVGEDHEPRAFNVFGPKLLAGIGNLPGTIEDRAVRIELRKRAPGEAVSSLRRDGRQQFEGLRRQVCRWVQDCRANILAGARGALLDGLPDRAADNWSPLVAIAEAAGADWGQRARVAALALTVNDAVQERAVMLLEDLRSLFDERSAERLPTTDILDYLAGLSERPWPEVNRGKPMSANQLARLLIGFGVRPATIRFPTGTAKGYTLSALADSFSRYLPPAQPLHRNNPSGARLPDGFGAVTGAAGVTDQKPLGGPPPLSCYGVTAETEGEASWSEDDWGEAAAERAAIVGEG